MANGAHFSGVKIVSLRISNFRALQNVEMDLGDLTVMVGANNSGKTSILDAIQAAVSACSFFRIRERDVCLGEMFGIANLLHIWRQFRPFLNASNAQ